MKAESTLQWPQVSGIRSNKEVVTEKVDNSSSSSSIDQVSGTKHMTR